MDTKEIVAKFKEHGVPIGPDDAWKVQQATVIKHKALERLAAALRITWKEPKVLRAERDECVLMVFGGLPGTDAFEWSIGECLVVPMKDSGRKNKWGKPEYEVPEGAAGNYQITPKQAAYPYAMAEKRAKDRVIIKLAGLHGAYSEDEADDFKQKGQAQPQDDEPRRLPAPQEPQSESPDAIPYSNEESPPTAPVEPPEMHEAPPPSSPDMQQEPKQASRPEDNRTPTEKAEAIKQKLLACKSPAEIAKLMGHKAVIDTLEDLGEELVEEIRVLGRKRNADLKAAAAAVRKAESAANTNQPSAKAANANGADQAEQAV